MELDTKVLSELNRVFDKLNSEGKLMSESLLTGYYDIFWKMFGPEKLKQLWGELLLETIYGESSENRGSLVYWLEFKGEEGLLWAGSMDDALGFGLCRSKETGVWMACSGKRQVRLSVEEAVGYAVRHRDQLVSGAELLERLRENGTDDDYRVLQEEMDKIAPDVSNTEWARRYFSMLYPEKLDCYHGVDRQRYHLMKLLQVPAEGRGRYFLAGGFVALAGELDISMNNLTRVLDYRNGRPHTYWRIGTTDGAKPRNRWALMQDGGCIAIGWPDLGDLSGYKYSMEGIDGVKALMGEKYYPESASAAGKKGLEAFRFTFVIPDSGLALACDGETVLGIGRVTGPYYYLEGADFPHRRQVEWLSFQEWKLPRAEGLRTTVFEFQEAVNIVEAERRLLYGERVVVNLEKKPAVRLGELPARIQSVLERKGQVILSGPPGTGKTYWAEIAALELAARSHCNLAWSQLSDEQMARVYAAVRMCTFHPSYGYEDFLEGYRAEKSGEQMVFVLREGIFKKLCREAGTERRRKFYLIIDEINRGDIPRIFGELLTVLEKNKRGKKVVLPLSGDKFQVPDNVYIIATMNTADRSVALLDTALRRRFGFIELMPDSSALENNVINGIPLGPWLDALNGRICEHVGRDARNLQVGHSYFMEKGRPISDFGRLAAVIREDIIPLLEEYCYEDYDRLEKILGEKLVDVQNRQIRHDLFDLSRQDDLTVALLAPFLGTGDALRAVAAGEAAAGAEADSVDGTGE